MNLFENPFPSGYCQLTSGFPFKISEYYIHTEMNTFVLLALLGAALGWMLMADIKEERQQIEQVAKDEQNKLQRAKRVKKLTGKLQ